MVYSDGSASDADNGLTVGGGRGGGVMFKGGKWYSRRKGRSEPAECTQWPPEVDTCSR